MKLNRCLVATATWLAMVLTLGLAAPTQAQNDRGRRDRSGAGTGTVYESVFEIHNHGGYLILNIGANAGDLIAYQISCDNGVAVCLLVPPFDQYGNFFTLLQSELGKTLYAFDVLETGDEIVKGVTATVGTDSNYDLHAVSYETLTAPQSMEFGVHYFLDQGTGQ